MVVRQWPRHPAVPYVGPFVVFALLLYLLPRLNLPVRAALLLWILACGAAVLAWSRDVLEFTPARPVLGILLGVATFFLWIAPDALFPAWRSHWLFTNSLFGSPRGSLSAAALADPVSLALRTIRAVLIVPVVEELFWRGWLMRWLIDQDFRRVRLGAFTITSFSLTALFFALEHGPYWDVGLVTGAIYNYWMVKTGRLSDLILVHAVTNACLCAYVIGWGRWEYWL